MLKRRAKGPAIIGPYALGYSLTFSGIDNLAIGDGKLNIAFTVWANDVKPIAFIPSNLQ